MIQYDDRDFLHWLERLKVIRNLPKNTNLLFKTPEAKELLLELSTLPNTIDHVKWLMENHEDLISRVLLWKVISMVEIVFESMQLDFDSPYSTLGRKIQLSIDEETWQKPLKSPWLVSNETLQKAHHLLLNNAKIDEIVSLNTKDIYFLLFTEIIRLPENVDPLAWIKATYLELAALFTIRFVLSESIPTSWTHWDLLPHSKRLNNKFSAEVYSLELTCLDYGDAGFTIEGVIDIPNKLKKKYRQGVGVKWESAIRVNDDLGNSYLVCSHKYEGGTTKPWRWATYSMRLYCFPPISPGANRLQVSFITPVITVQKLLGNHLVPDPNLNTENFILTIDLNE